MHSLVRKPTVGEPARLSRAADRVALPLLIAAIVISAGCALTPPGTDDERSRAAAAGELYQRPFEERSIPELPATPAWTDVLQRAFLANGDLEAAYFEWEAALQRVEMASAYPNSNVMLGYSYTFSQESMKTFDRMMFSAGFDTMENLSLPVKVRAKGRVALDEAKAAGERFRTAKFDLQKRVLMAWADYSLLGEQARIQKDRVALDRSSIDGARAKLLAGGAQQDMVRAEVSLRESENALKDTEAELSASRAMLNGMLARAPNAPLEPPSAIPKPRAVRADDAVILATAVEKNPQLGALAQQVAGRSGALELARLQWIPDINPSVAFAGSIAQTIGVAVVLPTKIAEIRGGIKESQAMLRSSQAMLRQARIDRAGSLVAALAGLRNAQRQASLVETSIVPLTEQVLTVTSRSYSAGVATFLDLIDAKRMALEARLALAEARTTQDKRLAELEALMGTDIETLTPDPGRDESKQESQQ